MNKVSIKLILYYDFFFFLVKKRVWFPYPSQAQTMLMMYQSGRSICGVQVIGADPGVFITC